MKRFLALFTTLALLLALLAGCGQAAPVPPAQTSTPTPEAPVQNAPTPAAQTPAEKPELAVASLKGPTGMGMVHLMEQNALGETAADYAFTLASTPDELSGKLITGEVDIAAVPINLAATLYNKTEGGVKMAAINTLGVLYILENGESIGSFADLGGKTIYATGQGATPEFILNYLLQKHGIAESVTVEYMNDHAELSTLLAAGQVELAMLPEPNVTMALMNNESLRVALSLTEEWNAFSGGTQLVQGCIVARKDIVENQPEALTQFLAEYAASTAFANEHVEEAAALIAKYEIMGAAPAAKRALPNSNIVCITGEAMVESASAMLQILYDANPKSVGGSLPDEGLYFLGQ